MNPAVQTKSSDGFKFKSKGSNWKTIGRSDLGGSSEKIGTQVRNNWGLNLLVADNWTVWGLSGRQLERIATAHLEQNPR